MGVTDVSCFSTEGRKYKVGETHIEAIPKLTKGLLTSSRSHLRNRTNMETTGRVSSTSSLQTKLEVYSVYIGHLRPRTGKVRRN